MAYKVPGVKIKEKRIFGRSVPTNDTAVPVFIGYTLKNPEGVHRLNSFKEYVSKFGGGHYPLAANKKKLFFLYESVKLFYANGGSTCYIISIGNFKSEFKSASDLEAGLDKLVQIQQGNLVLVPDTVSLKTELRGAFFDKLLEKCSSINQEDAFINQFAILDADVDTKKHAEEKSIQNLTSDERLVYGAMYHPWLQTSIISEGDIEIGLLSDDNLESTLKALSQSKAPKDLKQKDAPTGEEKDDAPKKLTPAAIKKALAGLTLKERSSYLRRNADLKSSWNNTVKEQVEKNRLLPPSGAVAGAFVRSDTKSGIQKAPANIVLHGVNSLHQVVTDAIQKEFNAPDNGKAVNCIRTFVNNGIKIWGARTLDCNDLDYRYVNVRRTMSMLQGSIKALLENYVFEDNTERTWMKIRAALNKFLKTMLARGILYGTTPSEAFDFAVGFGETMTEEDINEGIIRVEVRVALIRPAEFIEIIFEQKSMEGASTEEASEGEEEGDA